MFMNSLLKEDVYEYTDEIQFILKTFLAPLCKFKSIFFSSFMAQNWLMYFFLKNVLIEKNDIFFNFSSDSSDFFLF